MICDVRPKSQYENWCYKHDRSPIECLNEEIRLLREYVKLLGDELRETLYFAHSRGWKSTRFEAGQIIREKLGMEEK